MNEYILQNGYLFKGPTKKSCISWTSMRFSSMGNSCHRPCSTFWSR